MEIRQDFNAELMEQRAELQASLLGDEAVEPGAFLGVVFLLRHHPGDEQPLHRAQIDGDVVATERRGADEGHDERRDAVDVLERLHAVRDRMLLGIVEREAVGRFEHPLEHPAEREGGPGWIGKVVEGFGEFGDRRDADFIEIEIRLAEPLVGPRRHVIRGVLEAAGV